MADVRLQPLWHASTIDRGTPHLRRTKSNDMTLARDLCMDQAERTEHSRGRVTCRHGKPAPHEASPAALLVDQAPVLQASGDRSEQHARRRRRTGSRRLMTAAKSHALPATMRLRRRRSAADGEGRRRSGRAGGVGGIAGSSKQGVWGDTNKKAAAINYAILNERINAAWAAARAAIRAEPKEEQP